MIYSSDYQMEIFDRYGEVVFKTTINDEGWNGRKFNEGEWLPEGSYVAKVTFNNQIKKQITLISNVMLIK
jgi:gliding motility-associated-like protein